MVKKSKFWKTIENVSRYRPKDNIFQILCSWVDGQKIPEKRQKIPLKRPWNGQKIEFWKTIENLSSYRPKDNIFKTLGSYAKNYVHEVKNSIKSSKIVKNGPQIVKNKNFQKIFFFCSFYVIMSLHAKNCACRSNGVACGQYKDKEEKNSEKNPVEWWIILIEMCKNMA